MQEINEKPNEQGKVSEKPKDRISFRKLEPNPSYLQGDLTTTMFNPERVSITKWDSPTPEDLFVLKFGGSENNARMTIFVNRNQVEGLRAVCNDALSWADIPKNTKVI